MKVTTGHQTTIGEARVSRAHELLRMAYHAHAELVSDPVADGSYPTYGKILRSRQISAGSTAAGIGPTFAPIAGLEAVKIVIHHPESWNARRREGVTLKDDQRVVTLVDIPATVSEVADVLLLSDLVGFVDSIYGESIWRVVELRQTIAGATRAVVEYAHSDESA